MTTLAPMHPDSLGINLAASSASLVSSAPPASLASPALSAPAVSATSPTAGSPAASGADISQTDVPQPNGTEKPERFIYDKKLKVIDNILKGVAFATLDYPEMSNDEVKNVLRKCRSILLSTIRNRPVPECRYKEGQLAVFRQVMEIFEGCMAAHRAAERQEGAIQGQDGFAPVSARQLAYMLRPICRRSYFRLCPQDMPSQSYPCQLQEKYYPGYTPDWNPGPKDAGNLKFSSKKAWALLGRAKGTNSSFNGYVSAYSPPEQLAAAFGLSAPDVERNYCLNPKMNGATHPQSKITALMRLDGAHEPVFRTVSWAGESDFYDGKRYGRRVLRKRPVHHRCLVPLDGFFVWTVGGQSATRQRYYLRPEPPNTLFAVAAILDPRYPGEGDPHNHPVVIMTIPEPPMMRGMHQGCLPMALPQSEWKRWLEPGPLTEDDLESMARSCAAVAISAQQVGENFYKYASDDIRCILPEEEILARGWKVEPPPPATPNPQEQRTVHLSWPPPSRLPPAHMPFEGFLSSYSPPEELAAAFGREAPNVTPNYCLGIGVKIRALMQEEDADDAFFRVVRWVDDSGSYGSTLYGRYARRRPVHRRCLVPLDGFFVWGNGAIHYIHPESPDTVFVVAAILDPYYKVKSDPNEHPVVLMTIPAPPFMRGMKQTCLPMVLPPSAWRRWIEPGRLTKDDVAEMARSCEQIRMAMHAVGADYRSYKPNDVRSIMTEEDILARGWKVETWWKEHLKQPNQAVGKTT